MFVVDTNLLVYAADEDSPSQETMRSLLEQWGASAEEWSVTWSIVYEFLTVTTRRSVFTHPLSFSESWSFIEELMGFPSFKILLETDRHTEIIRELKRECPGMAGARFHDLHIAAVMKEHGVTEIRTADSDFRHFKFLRVTNPLAH